jgi:hypothetical protein
MRYELKQKDDMFVHVETGQCAGYVAPLPDGTGFSVHRNFKIFDYECDKIGVVTALKDALPTLTDFYEKQWPLWKRTRGSRFDENVGYTMYTKYIKSTFYGVFTVQQEDGRWVATRCQEKLLRSGVPAFFPNAEVARHVVDLHERDGVADFPALHDGYSWEYYPWLPGRSTRS